RSRKSQLTAAGVRLQRRSSGGWEKTSRPRKPPGAKREEACPWTRRLRKVRDDAVREQLLVLDRLPVLEVARVDGDRNLRQTLADLAHGLDPLDHVLRRADPDQVAP